MTATFVGGALGATVSGALMARFGWHGVVAFGIAAEAAAALVHRCGERR